MRHMIVWMALSTMLMACEDTKPTPKSPKAEPETVPQKKATAPKKNVEAPKENVLPGAGKIASPLIWKIDAGKGPVYILGTVHIGVDAKKQFPAGLWEVFKSSKKFVMETDLAGAQASMGKQMALPPGKSLETMLGPDSWKLLDKHMGGAAATFKSMQPWFVISMLIPKMLTPEQLRAPMDKTLLDDAIAQKKKIGFLESAQFQLDVLKKTLTIEELQKMLKEFDEQKIELDTLLNAYVESDVKKLEELSFKDLESEKERYEILFFKRNEAWVPQIKKFAQEEGDVFVAVGAGHLFGPRGVLKLLEKEGLKATRVSFNK